MIQVFNNLSNIVYSAEFSYFCPLIKYKAIMWKRIQTICLALSSILIISMFFCRFATIAGPEGSEAIIRYYEKVPFLVLLIMLTSANIIALFCGKSGFLQARVCMIAGLISIGFQIWLGVDFISNHNDMAFSISALFPLAAAVLNFTAARNALIDAIVRPS